MTLTKGTPIEMTRLYELAELMPLSLDQYHRMIETGIICEEEPVEFAGGHLVSKDQGTDYAWPFGSMPANAPRLDTGAPIWPLSLDQYHRMIQTGILPEGGSYELLYGYLVAKDQGRGPGMGHAPAHATSVTRTLHLLMAAFGATWVVRCQLPITLGTRQAAGSGKEPEPDVAVALGPDQRYTNRHPGPQDLRLVVEVADTSLSSDRGRKAFLYASDGIPLYWIVNLIDRQLEVYSDPDPVTGQYRSRQILAEDAQVVLSWPGLALITFAVKDFLP